MAWAMRDEGARIGAHIIEARYTSRTPVLVTRSLSFVYFCILEGYNTARAQVGIFSGQPEPQSGGDCLSGDLQMGPTFMVVFKAADVPPSEPNELSTTRLGPSRALLARDLWPPGASSRQHHSRTKHIKRRHFFVCVTWSKPSPELVVPCKGGVCLEQRVSGISWSALTLEAGKSPTEVPRGRHVPMIMGSLFIFSCRTPP